MFQMLALGSDLVSDLLFTYFLISGSFIERGAASNSLAVLFILTRFVHPFSGYFILDSLINGKSGCLNKFATNRYDELVDRPHWVLYSKEYAVLMILSLVESQAVKLLPWKSSDFCIKSGGYPDHLCFAVCTYSKFTQATICVIIQIIVFVISNKSNFTGASCNFILTISIATSVVHIRLTTLEGLLQRGNIKSSDNKDALMRAVLDIEMVNATALSW